MGVKILFEKVASPIKVKSLNERPRADESGYNAWKSTIAWTHWTV